MLTLHHAAYMHPDRDVLFTDISLVVHRHDKIALIGNNGIGKSTLLKILAGILEPSAGFYKADAVPYYVPQVFGQFNDVTVAEALGIDGKLQALYRILDGIVTDDDLATLDDDWAIEERCREAFAHWQLHGVELTQRMGTLSGGQKTKVLLAGIMVHTPTLVLLDEPGNHLDTDARNILYDYITSTPDTLVVVSHDRTLLNLLGTVYELDGQGITIYGGNYDFYVQQKAIELDALQQDVKGTEKALRKAKDVERESMERQHKLDARGKKKQVKAGLPTIAMNTFRNNAEKSTSRTKDVHARKIDAIAQKLGQLRNAIPDAGAMKLNLDDSALYAGKIMVTGEDVNVGYDDRTLWAHTLNFQIVSGERIAIRGPNGAGKTTLIDVILGWSEPLRGTVRRAPLNAVYIDQDYSLVDNHLTVYEQAMKYNSGALQEHDVKIRLNRFLFTKDDWGKACHMLSGGEKMRLMLCSLTIGNQAPDMIVLDEPTNNLDIRNIEILTSAINDYKGTLLVVSHDEMFLQQIGVGRTIVVG